MPTSQIKVLIIDDSEVMRQLLTFIIESDPQLKVIGYAESGEQALEFLKHHQPDAITMDIVMPRMDGFEVSRKIMQTTPIPIVIISGYYTSQNVEQSFRALEAGALAILEKPYGLTDPKFKEHAAKLIDTIHVISGIKLITRRHTRDSPAPALSFLPMPIATPKAVAIGASLGGPAALNTLLTSLPASFPVPILIVQHVAHGFTQGLVNWLNKTSPLQVLLAQDGQQALPGYVYVAPDQQHLTVKKNNILSLISEPSKGIRPAVAQLFFSMAHIHGPHGIGVMLTGMGKDGAEEMVLMKQMGAFTIAQDEETSIVFGMPGEVVAKGGATCILPLQQIAPTLKRIVKSSG